MSKRTFSVAINPQEPDGLANGLVDLLILAQERMGIGNRALERISGTPNQYISRVRHLGVDPTCGTLDKLFTALGVKIEVKITLPPSTRRTTTN